MNLVDSLYKASRLYPDKMGVICGEERFTYREFSSRVYRLAEGFKGQGIEKGDRIAILHQNCHYFLEAYYAAAVIGAMAGTLLAPAIYLVERVLRLQDPSAALAVHGVSGLWGLLAVAIFADGRHGVGWNGVGVTEYLGVIGQGVSGHMVVEGFRPDIQGQLYAQLIGIAAIMLFVAILTWIPFGLLHKFYTLPAIIAEEAERIESETIPAPATGDPSEKTNT